jgi:hypothetical protein
MGGDRHHPCLIILVFLCTLLAPFFHITNLVLLCVMLGESQKDSTGVNYSDNLTTMLIVVTALYSVAMVWFCTYVTYFVCSKFEEGSGRAYLKVLYQRRLIFRGLLSATVLVVIPTVVLCCWTVHNDSSNEVAIALLVTSLLSVIITPLAAVGIPMKLYGRV